MTARAANLSLARSWTTECHAPPDLPSFETDFQETLNPNNALGVKGGSESGTIGPPAAIGNAIVDALWDLGVRHVEMPYTPSNVRRAIEMAGAG